MNKETINTIGKWIIAALLIGASMFFAAKGNNEAARSFGIGAGLFSFYFLKKRLDFL